MLKTHLQMRLRQSSEQLDGITHLVVHLVIFCKVRENSIKFRNGNLNDLQLAKVSINDELDLPMRPSEQFHELRIPGKADVLPDSSRPVL